MKPQLRLVLVVAAMALAISSSAWSNGNVLPFPALLSGLQDGIGNTIAKFLLRQGWFEGQLAWYIQVQPSEFDRYLGNASNNADIVYGGRYPRLVSLIGNAANPMYVVQNYQQGPVFSSAPGEDDYSGIWRVIYVKWKAGVTRRPIISDLDLPGPAEADITETDIVVDRPILALGPLDGPWYPAVSGSYRQAQVLAYSAKDKLVTLPAWYTYGQVKKTKKPTFSVVIIPDVADPDLAALLKANYAPGLALADAANVQKFWVQDWTLQPLPPLFQFPVVEKIDNLMPVQPGSLERNLDFSPVMDLIRLEREIAPLTIVTNPSQLRMYLAPEGSGFLPVGDPVRVNAPVCYSVLIEWIE
jgi:hypothetical protein